MLLLLSFPSSSSSEKHPIYLIFIATMAFTTTCSLSQLSVQITASTHIKPSSTLFAFPNLTLKSQRNSILALSCSAKPLPCESARLSLETGEQEEEEDVSVYDYDFDDDEIEHGGLCAVPKKRMSRSKTKIRKNIWKRKARVAAMKAYSLAKSIATGNSKSFLVISKASSSSSSTSPSE